MDGRFCRSCIYWRTASIEPLNNLRGKCMNVEATALIPGDAAKPFIWGMDKDAKLMTSATWGCEDWEGREPD